MLEVDMVDQCYEYLVNSKSCINVIREVPFLSRCIDMVMVTDTNEMITIEFKIKDWRHALEQVKSHKLGADRAYICLPQITPSESLLNALIDECVGLFLFSPEKKETMFEYLPAPKNPRKIDAFALLLHEKVNYIVDNALN